jgi:hypothetical protein
VLLTLSALLSSYFPPGVPRVDPIAALRGE